MNKTHTDDKEWVKLTYIFSSVEAIVFTAVGFVFGKEVSRSRAISAEKREEKAKNEKRELAREVLDKLPKAPSTPDKISLDGLRNKAERYLDD